MPFIDANDNLIPEELKTDICIIGAGAAGITLARNLKTVKDIILVESGNFEMSGASQSLYKGKNLALKYYDLLKCRLRYMGGTTNHWGGYCRSNDPIDYEGRAELGLPKWPISKDELTPYINLAKTELDLKYDFFENTELLKDKKISKEQLLENHHPDFQTKVFQITKKRRFREIYKHELQKQTNLQVLLNLNAIHIQLNEQGDNVKEIIFKTIKGKKILIKAKKFILSCHAIENARLLLKSNDVAKTGIGNTYDHLGRYFMEHIYLKASKLIPSDSFPKLYDFKELRDSKLNANLSFSDNYTRENQLLQYYCRFYPVYVEDKEKDSLRNIKRNINEPYKYELYNDIKNLVNNFNDVKNFLISQFGFYNPAPKYYQLDHRIEQAPNPDSRIILSNDKDLFGMPLADIQWKLTDHDYRSFKLGQAKIVKELSAMGAGRFELEELTPDLIRERIKGHYHHIGTTRMSNLEEDGVVDKNCKVHNVNNLYVAGSSTFPTAGYSGPTMMIIAMSIRLANHLSNDFLYGPKK
ncbi:GMC oxidoreductase [Paraglaciecola arctica]|uniref:GMC oxidoreductase n=1 Tax=Paraglaciecola arctica TaxID=1128911 RepID=UPI001C0735DF|nr:GMC oxidoreductase [Paraglaciecola arctica]MBU3004337.1 hypothetical protein [Paraglaciecola arctica]